jgi:hypothetical protein
MHLPLNMARCLDELQFSSNDLEACIMMLLLAFFLYLCCLDR